MTLDGAFVVGGHIEAVGNAARMLLASHSPEDVMTQRLEKRPDLPTGTVTFLFTDIEGSTRLLQSMGDAYHEVLERHSRLLREAVAKADGVEVSTEGDSFFVVFSAAPAAVEATVAAQRALAGEIWPTGIDVRVRMGLHTGLGIRGGDNYLGLDVHKAARIASAAHGGQVLLSGVSAGLLSSYLPEGVRLRDMGDHRLKDLTELEHLFQLVIADLPSEFPSIRTLNVVPHNLPLQLTSFIGREREVGEAVRLLSTNRLLTLTGPGGTGKTRLSLEVAAQVAEAFTDGVFFVSLSSLSDPDLVPTAILESLGLRTTAGGVQPRDHLLNYLGAKSLLLVLDNIEQLLGAGPFIAEMLRAGPRVKVLVTSRAALRISGEQEMPVPPLDVPEPAGLVAVDALARFEGVQLFTERALGVRPDFRLTEHNAAAVARLTARLDGLPLALELAASRIKLLTPEAILERLTNRLLSSPARDMPARQQTLINAIGWSYDLLSEPSRRLFERLAVFVGGAMLDQIERVCGPSEEIGTDVLEGLDVLVEQSLLRQTEVQGQPRFRMLMVVRDFAQAALVARGEEDELRRRHALAYLELAEEAEPHLLTSQQARLLDRLASDHDNLRAAIDWAIEQQDDEKAQRLVGALWRFWQIRGHLFEARERIEKALALPSRRPRGRAKALEALGGVEYWRGAPFRDAYEESLSILREHGTPAEIANALYNLSFALQREGDFSGAEGCLSEALSTSERLGDRLGIGRALWAIGSLGFQQSGRPLAGVDLDRMMEYSATAVAEFEQLDAPFDLGWALYTIGEAWRGKGDPKAARSYYTRSLELFVGANDLSAVVLFLHTFAALAVLEGDLIRAARLAGAARGLKVKTGAGIIDVEFHDINRELNALLGQADQELAAAFEEGEQMSAEEAANYALGPEAHETQGAR